MKINEINNITRNIISALGVIVFVAIISSNLASAREIVDLPQDMEIELALSALPKGFRDEASIYIRDPERGYVLYREGTNEWTTFVARTSVRFYEADWEYSYPTDQLIPQAHDKVGMSNHVIPYFDIERLRIEGVPARKAKEIIRERFHGGTYKSPEKGGLSYMLAPMHRAYMEPAKSDLIMTVSAPHHMPYAPNVDPKSMGMIDSLNRSGILDHGGHDSGPHGYMYFMVQPDQAEAIRANYSDLLTKLCNHHSNWCLPDAQQNP